MERVDLNQMAAQQKDTVYGQMVRIARNRKNAQAGLLQSLLDAYAALGQLGRVQGYREWLLRTTAICLDCFPGDSLSDAATRIRRTWMKQQGAINGSSQEPLRGLAKVSIKGKQEQGGFMQVDVEHLGNVKFAVKARKHVILSDQAEQDGGTDEGMTPPELLLGSLASCAAYYAAQYLRSRHLATSGTRVTVFADKLKHPARLGNFRIEVTAPVALTEDQLAGIERAVHVCLVHNTLLGASEITTTVKTEAEQQPEPVSA